MIDARPNTPPRTPIIRARAIETERGERLSVSTFNDLTEQVREGQASLAVERQFREPGSVGGRRSNDKLDHV